MVSVIPKYDVLVDYLFQGHGCQWPVSYQFKFASTMFAFLFFFGELQHELDEIKSLWNSHRICHIRNSNSPGGRPDVLYFTPEGSGVTDCKFPLDVHDVNLAMDYCETPSLFGCSAELLELSRITM